MHGLLRTMGVDRTGRRRHLLAPLLIPLVLGCSSDQQADVRAEGWARSMTALGAAALEAFALGDTAALGKHQLTRSEHDQEIWPELPAARSGSGFTSEMAWENISRRDRRARSRNLTWFDGRRPSLVRVECRGATQDFESFQVYTDCWVRFRMREGEAEAQLFKDVVERGGGYKIFRYYDEGVRLLDDAGAQLLDASKPT